MGEDEKNTGRNVLDCWLMEKLLMKKELLSVFSGFPEHHFSEEITKRLRPITEDDIHELEQDI